MAPSIFFVFWYDFYVKTCPKCKSEVLTRDGVIYNSVMTRTGKKRRKIQNYRCDQGHCFNFSDGNTHTNSFIELVVFIYLNSLSLNVTMNIVRATYDTNILSKATILDFLETAADVVPDIDDIDNIFHPRRSGYLAVDGVWFTFRGMDIVLLVCFDPESFDVIDATWSVTEDESAYSRLLIGVGEKLGFDAIKGIYGDGDKGLMKSLKKHFPLVPFQLCVVHKEMRMGQLVPVKSVKISKRMSNKTKKEILQFQELFRAVLYADSKKASYKALQRIRDFTKKSDNPKFTTAYNSLKHNFKYTLTHFDHNEMMRDNNMIECFNGIIKPKLRLMKGFKKYKNLHRYLKLFILNYRFHPLKESRFEERRNLTPLEIAGVQLPKYTNFLTFLRKSLNLDFTHC